MTASTETTSAAIYEVVEEEIQTGIEPVGPYPGDNTLAPLPLTAIADWVRASEGRKQEKSTEAENAKSLRIHRALLLTLVPAASLMFNGTLSTVMRFDCGLPGSPLEPFAIILYGGAFKPSVKCYRGYYYSGAVINLGLSSLLQYLLVNADPIQGSNSVLLVTDILGLLAGFVITNAQYQQNHSAYDRIYSRGLFLQSALVGLMPGIAVQATLRVQPSGRVSFDLGQGGTK